MQIFENTMLNGINQRSETTCMKADDLKHFYDKSFKSIMVDYQTTAKRHHDKH